MIAIRLQLAVAAVAAILSGCATAPSLPDESRVSVEEIVYLTKCELREALIYADQHAPWFTAWSALPELTLKVGTQAGASIGAPSFLVPINIGTWTTIFDVGGGANANGVAKMKFPVKLEDTRALNCPPRDETVDLGGRTRDLGLAAWLKRAMTAANNTGIKEDTDSMSYSIEFVVFANGSIQPKWDLFYGNGRRFNIGPRLNGEVRDTHIIDIALKPPQTPRPTRVIIVQDLTQRDRTGPERQAPAFREQAEPPAARTPPAAREVPGRRSVPETRRGVDPQTLRDLREELRSLQNERSPDRLDP